MAWPDAVPRPVVRADPDAARGYVAHRDQADAMPFWSTTDARDSTSNETASRGATSSPSPATP
jgi:hypothetical protein